MEERIWRMQTPLNQAPVTKTVDPPQWEGGVGVYVELAGYIETLILEGEGADGILSGQKIIKGLFLGNA